MIELFEAGNLLSKKQWQTYIKNLKKEVTSLNKEPTNKQITNKLNNIFFMFYHLKKLLLNNILLLYL